MPFAWLEDVVDVLRHQLELSSGEPSSDDAAKCIVSV